MSGEEKDEGLEGSLQRAEPTITSQSCDDDGFTESRTSLFHHPRFDPAEVFKRHHASLSRALEEHPYPGILAGVATDDELELTWIAATPDQVRAAIIGRHHRATLSLPPDQSTAALRHLALLVRANEEGPVARLLDLQTESGFAAPDGRRFEAIRANGYTFLSAAGTILMLFPTGPDERLADDPHTAWSDIPPHRWLESSHPRSAKVPPLQTLNETFIQAQAGPRGCRSKLCRDQEIPLGLMTIAAEGDETHVRVSGRALDEGFLIGRYDRCDVGGPEADESLSRVHLLIIREGQQIIAIDTASTNGTYIGDTRVHLIELLERTKLDLGGVLDITWRFCH